MKATIERATLLKSLSHVQSVVERRNTIPILSNVLIEARDDGSIRLMATDLDLQVDESVPANVAQAGAITVSAHTLFDIVRKLPEGSQVELAAAEGKMQVNRRPLAVQPVDPAARRFPGDRRGRAADPLRASGGDPPPAHRQDQVRDLDRGDPLLSDGIFLHVADDQLKAAATDGHRLARVTVPKPDGADGMPDVIVPRKCVTELRKLLDEVEGTVEVSLSPTKVRFGLGSAVLTSKLIDGTFPDYNRVIPTGNDKLLKLDPKSFMAGVDRVSTIATEKTRAVKMSLDRDKVTLSVPARRMAWRPRSCRPIMAPTGSRSASTPATSRHPRRDRRRHGRGPPRRRRRPDPTARERQVQRALRSHAHAGVSEVKRLPSWRWRCRSARTCTTVRRASLGVRPQSSRVAALFVSLISILIAYHHRKRVMRRMWSQHRTRGLVPRRTTMHLPRAPTELIAALAQPRVAAEHRKSTSRR